MDKLSEIRFPFSTFHWPAELDISSKMSNACSPRRLQSVEWSWLYSGISDLWKSSGGYLVFIWIRPKKNIYIYIFFLVSHELGTRSVFPFDTPGTWHFLQETIRLHPAAAGWNQRSFHTSSMSPAAAGAAQVAPWASWTFPPQGFAHQQLHPSAQFHSSYPIALILTGTHMAFRPQAMSSRTSWQ